MNRIESLERESSAGLENDCACPDPTIKGEPEVVVEMGGAEKTDIEVEVVIPQV